MNRIVCVVGLGLSGLLLAGCTPMADYAQDVKITNTSADAFLSEMESAGSIPSYEFYEGNAVNISVSNDSVLAGNIYEKLCAEDVDNVIFTLEDHENMPAVSVDPCFSGALDFFNFTKNYGYDLFFEDQYFFDGKKNDARLSYYGYTDENISEASSDFVDLMVKHQTDIEKKDTDYTYSTSGDESKNIVFILGFKREDNVPFDQIVKAFEDYSKILERLHDLDPKSLVFITSEYNDKTGEVEYLVEVQEDSSLVEVLDKNLSEVTSSPVKVTFVEAE